ncbi:MAG: M23 family metallopeptidase [bacterium]|nr:M23 family metallopeptidase [bacterium]
MKQHTIIFVPHARAKFRKWRLSSLQVGLIAATLALVTVGGILATIAYFNTSFDRGELEQVRVENSDLRTVNQGFETSIRDLEQQVADYQQRIHKLAIVAGVTELSPSEEGGIGGPGPDEYDSAMGDQMAALEGTLIEMNTGMQMLERKLDERYSLISATPAVTPVRGLLTSGFGYRSDPFDGDRAFHRGIDIVAPAGKEVLATGDGIVTRAGRVAGLGNAVYISHGFGFMTRYGHMSRIHSKVGQQVKRGDVIGLVGSSGRATGTHVHYEVHVDGRAVNPRGYILDGTGP